MLPKHCRNQLILIIQHGSTMLTNKVGENLRQNFAELRSYDEQIYRNLASLFINKEKELGFCESIGMRMTDGTGVSIIDKKSVAASYKKVFSYKTYSIVADLSYISRLVGRTIPFDFYIPETMFFPKELIDKLDLLFSEIDSSIKLGDKAQELANEVCKKFGTVNYVLTQFPELNLIFKDMEFSRWKPNKYYKVPPRSSFENCDSFIQLFGNLAMEGIKIENIRN